MKMILFGFTMAAALWAACSPAAASIEFNFQGDDSNKPVDSLAYSQGGLDVKVTGSLLDGGAAQVMDSGWGLGVFNPQDPLGDTHFFGGYAVDAKNGGEALTLEFSMDVRPKVLTFAAVGSYDTLQLEVDGVNVNLTSPLGTTNIKDHPASTNQVVIPDSMPAGRVLRFIAANYGTTSDGLAYDDWKLEKIDVEKIPEPATIVTWVLLGCCCLGWQRWTARG